MKILITITNKDIEIRGLYFISSMIMPGLNYKFIVVTIMN